MKDLEKRRNLRENALDVYMKKMDLKSQGEGAGWGREGKGVSGNFWKSPGGPAIRNLKEGN